MSQYRTHTWPAELSNAQINCSPFNALGITHEWVDGVPAIIVDIAALVKSMETLLNDMRYGSRMLIKSPGFTLIAILTLALGIGANTALFSVVNGVLLNPLPFPHADQLVAFYQSKPNFERGSLTYPNFVDLRNQSQTFAAMAVYREDGFNLTGVGQAELLRAETVSADFFSLLGVKPVVGRTFKPDEDGPGAPRVALISSDLWKRKFGSSPEVLGKMITLDGVGYTVAGVIPTFHLPIQNFRDNDVFVSIGQMDSPRLRDRKAAWGIDGIGRVKPGVSIGQARADLQQIMRNLAAAYPEADKGSGVTLISLTEAMVGQIKPFLLVLLGAVAFVLLIACVNVANLLLARSAGRAREFAIRAALGASQGRVIRQLLAESVLLAFAGGALGLILAAWGTQTALGLLPQTLPRSEEIGIDARVLIFTVAISLLSGILFGLAPALRTSRPNVHDTLKEGGRGASGTRHHAQDVFVVIETAMALVLLIGAGLMIRSLAGLWSVSPGFDPHNVLLFGLALPPSTAAGSPDAIRAALREMNDSLESIPGVQAASLSWGATPMSSDDEQLFWINGQPKPASQSDMNWSLDYVVLPDYLKVMRIPLDRGRFLTKQDDGHSPLVIVIDDVFARKYFPNQNPIGKRLNLEGRDTPAQIVGVVGHVKQWGLDSDDKNTLRAQVYLSVMQIQDKDIKQAPLGMGVVLRTAGSPLGYVESIRRHIAHKSGEHVMYGTDTMDSIISSSLAARRFSMILLGVFAALAVGLSSIGLYGVVSYVVGQRTREIGVRIALGAQRKDIFGPVLGQGLRMALVGVVIGLAAAFGLTRLLSDMLFGISATDPLTFLVVSIILVMVAVAASYLPARRATLVDPIVALRYD